MHFSGKESPELLKIISPMGLWHPNPKSLTCEAGSFLPARSWLTGTLMSTPSCSTGRFQDVGSLLFWTAPWLSGTGQAGGWLSSLCCWGITAGWGGYGGVQILLKAICYCWLDPSPVSPLLGWTSETSEQLRTQREVASRCRLEFQFYCFNTNQLWNFGKFKKYLWSPFSPLIKHN